MVSREDGRIVIWPAYFDRNLTRKEGRRVPKDLAVDKPSLEKIYAVLKDLGLDPEMDPEARYPSRQWEYRGRILVKKIEKKQKILRMVAEKISKH